MNGTIFGKKVAEYKIYVLDFSAKLVWNISHSKRNPASYYYKCS